MSVSRENLKENDQEIRELRKAVFILAEQVGRIMADKQLKAAEMAAEPTLSERFLDQVALAGVTDAIKAKRPFMKVMWILIFTITFCTTAYLVYKVIVEYDKNPTATKVTVLRNATYAFPSIVLCLDTWFSLQKAIDLGFTKNAVKYALNYLIRYEDNLENGETKSNCQDWRLGESEFLDIFDRLNYSNLIDFYKDISLDAMLSPHLNRTAITFLCTGCVGNTTTLKKLVIDRGVCYQVPLKSDTGKLRGSDGLRKLSVHVPDLTEGLAELKPYWRLYINTQLNQIQPTSMFLSIDKTTSTAITISEQQFHMVNTHDDQCAEEGDASTAAKCATKCLSDHSGIQLGCRLLSLETDTYRRSPASYCNRCSWKRLSLESQERDDESVQSCVNGCPHPCRTCMFDGVVDRHWSPSIETKLLAINNHSEIKFEAAKVYFKNAAVLRGGILTFTEVFTYSMETLIGTIGGTCGIWISVGVLTVIQLIIFFIDLFLTHGLKMGKAVIRRHRANIHHSEIHPSSSVAQVQSTKI